MEALVRRERTRVVAVITGRLVGLPCVSLPLRVFVLFALLPAMEQHQLAQLTTFPIKAGVSASF